MVAGPRDQAIAAFALARYAGAPGVDAALGAEAARLASRVLVSLETVSPGEADPLAEPVSAAACVIAADAIGAEAARRAEPELDVGGAFVAGARDAVVAFGADDGAVGRLAPGARALVAFALAVAAERDDSVRPLAERRVRELFRRTPVEALPDVMPWLLWAELRLTAADGPVPAAQALRDMRAVVWQFQIDEDDAGEGNADLAGGIVFNLGRTLLPGWQSLRPLGAIATMLGDPRLTDPGELAPELARLGRSLRFVAQLSVRESELHMMRDARRARGGVRRALWDQTQPLGAQSMALLTLTETLRSVRARSGGP